MKIFEHLLSLLAWLMFAAFFICLFQLMSGCATTKPQTYEQILRSMPPDERQRVEAEVADMEAYILENASRQP